MKLKPRQLTLDLAARPALGEEDFFLSKSNALALRMIESWPDWRQYGQILLGPKASGKTHLMNVWRLRSGAELVAASELDQTWLRRPGDHPPVVAVEDIDRGLRDEAALFHLLNTVRERQGHVLLTLGAPEALDDIGLKDLQSRLKALPVTAINPPDDDLLRAVMIKQFGDRQINIEPQLIKYLFQRMERSMEAVSRLVDALDKGSLGAGRRITKPLARKILADGYV